ncbi:MAG: tRNA (adenosine(37)-N6)-threonylcarbamoyltransferase complex dimerization subunit type 1 TsaB [Parvularculaceae bacterium]
MITLGFDTALQSCSLAILRDGVVLSDKFLPLEKGHAEALAPLAASALAEAGMAVSDLDRVGVVVGPGGFAGVRVGLAFARGLALGTGVAAVGVTSLEALAAAVEDAPQGGLAAAVIDARRGQVYAGLYGPGGAPRLAPFVADPEIAAEKLKAAADGALAALVGSGAGQVSAHLPDWPASNAPAQIDAKIVARLAARAPLPDGPPAPLYLRPPDARPPGRSALAGLSQA